MAVIHYSNEYCICDITFITRDSLHVSMQLRTHGGGVLYWWAAAPPQRGISLAGSCLPFANAIHAYDNTINRGVISLTSNHVEFDMRYPNAYYIGLGSVYIAPHINFKLEADNLGMRDVMEWTVPINAGVPYRMLAEPPARKGPEFYARKDFTVRSQEQILRDSAYPCGFDMAPDFWGGKPPC
jgi:hypothetical protein